VSEKELEVIEPLLSNEINRNVELEPIRVKEDELKFKLKELDLAFIPLPLTLFMKTYIFPAVSWSTFSPPSLGVVIAILSTHLFSGQAGYA